MARVATYGPQPGPPGPAVVLPEPPELELDVRELLVAYAETQLGNTDPTRYWMRVLGEVPIPAPGKRIHWCGAFVLDCLHEVGLCDWPWIPVKGFLFRLGWKTTAHPKPGDIKYIATKSRHHGLVTGGDDTWIDSIDGNTGPAPGVVSRQRKRRGEPNVFYYSIERLVKEWHARHEAARSGIPG